MIHAGHLLVVGYVYLYDQIVISNDMTFHRGVWHAVLNLVRSFEGQSRKSLFTVRLGKLTGKNWLYILQGEPKAQLIGSNQT